MEKLTNSLMGTLIMSALIAVVFFFRSKKSADQGVHRLLCYSLFLKAFSLAGTSLFITGVIYLMRNTSLVEMLQALLLMSPFILLVSAGMVETLMFQLRYDTKKITQISPWSGTTEIISADLVGMTKTRFTDQIVLVSSDGSRIRVPKQINGSEELLQLARMVIQANSLKDSE